jgi:cobalt-zinc-cadmium efflux system protein
MSEHNHSHGHTHGNIPKDFSNAFLIGIALNISFVGIESFYGFKINSLALLADAGHNFSDVVGLVLGLIGVLAGKTRPNDKRTYGWKRATILAAFANALLLLVAMGSLISEAISRLNSPIETDGITIMAVAGVGIIINGATAILFMHGRKSDLNIRAAFLHMAADALVSAAVVMAGALSLWFSWSFLDPIASLLIAAVILVSTWSLFYEALHLLFDGVPKEIELPQVRSYLASLEGVSNVHDLHIWAMSTSQVAMTAHLVMPHGSSGDQFLETVTHELHHRFEIVHPTIQIETNLVDHGCH